LLRRTWLKLYLHRSVIQATALPKGRVVALRKTINKAELEAQLKNKTRRHTYGLTKCRKYEILGAG
jgi:hypothetical protein